MQARGLAWSRFTLMTAMPTDCIYDIHHHNQSDLEEISSLTKFTYTERVCLDGSLYSCAAIGQLFRDEAGIKYCQAHST